MALHRLNQKELERRVKDALDSDAPVKISDGSNLQLVVRETGGMSWQLAYKLDGKRKTFSMGTYPSVTLSTARALAQEAREKIQKGEDPVKAKRALDRPKDAITVGELMKEWLSQHKKKWGATHYDDMDKAGKRDILPFVGSRPITSIAPDDVRTMLERVEKRGANYQLTRVRTVLSRMFEHAVDKDWIEVNPVVKVKRVTFNPHIPGHHPSVTEPNEFARLMKKLHSETSTLPIIALRLNALVFVRPQNLRFATWSQINFENRVWEAPQSQMKMGRAFLIPLADQTVELLSNLKQITSPNPRDLLFPTITNRSFSDVTLSKNLHRIGYKGRHCAHGFRSSAKTLLEEGGFSSKFTEKQLAHEIESKVARAYNRAEYWSDRVVMMQAWADYLDALVLSDKAPLPWSWFANWHAQRSMPPLLGQSTQMSDQASQV